MNWKTYQTLDHYQREEYNFRFKEPVTLPMRGMLTTVILFFSTVIILFFVVYLAMTEPVLAEYKSQVAEYMGIIGRLVWVTAWVIMAFLLEFIVRAVYRIYEYQKWLRENKIKIKYWWS